jgi:hypothetical protein
MTPEQVQELANNLRQIRLFKMKLVLAAVNIDRKIKRTVPPEKIEQNFKKIQNESPNLINLLKNLWGKKK